MQTHKTSKLGRLFCLELKIPKLRGITIQFICTTRVYKDLYMDSNLEIPSQFNDEDFPIYMQ